MFKNIFEKLYIFYKAYIERYRFIYYLQGGEDVILNNWI